MRVNNSPGAIENFFYSMPRITKYWFLLALVFSVVGRLNAGLYYYFALTYDDAIRRFQVWRFLTCTVTFPLTPSSGYSYLVTMYLLYSISSGLQKGDYSEREGDYFYMLLLCSCMHWVVSLFIVTRFFVLKSLVMSVLYIWAQLNSENEVSFLFGFRVKAMYLPYVIFAMEFILFFSGLNTLIGIVIGHIYFFLTYKYPIEFGGRDFIVTPGWIKRIFPNALDNRSHQATFNAFGTGGQQNPRSDPTAGANRGHTWGSGRRLAD